MVWSEGAELTSLWERRCDALENETSETTRDGERVWASAPGRAGESGRAEFRMGETPGRL